MKYHLYLFDFTNHADDAHQVMYEITSQLVTVADVRYHNLVSNFGEFEKIDEARAAIKEHAGKFGVELIEGQEFSSNENTLESYRWSLVVLTAVGTRKEYAEWAFDEARDDPETFKGKIDTACREAIEREIGYPDRETLEIMLHDYREGILAGEYDEE